MHQTVQEFNLSIYSGNLTTNEIIDQQLRLKKSFPGLPAEFYDILIERLKENNFNDARLKAAIDNLIDTCVYPLPTIANIISYDKTVKLYTYTQICDLVSNGDKMSNYKKVKSNFLNLWARVDDIEKYKLQVK